MRRAFFLRCFLKMIRTISVHWTNNAEELGNCEISKNLFELKNLIFHINQLIYTYCIFHAFTSLLNKWCKLKMYVKAIQNLFSFFITDITIEILQSSILTFAISSTNTSLFRDWFLFWYSFSVRYCAKSSNFFFFHTYRYKKKRKKKLI